MICLTIKFFLFQQFILCLNVNVQLRNNNLHRIVYYTILRTLKYTVNFLLMHKSTIREITIDFLLTISDS